MHYEKRAINWSVLFLYPCLRLTGSPQLAVMVEAPEMQAQMVSSHGLLAILEVLESKPARDVILRLLQIVNLVRWNGLL